ncbi:hypothetical protein Calhy_1787 [Caldicellulosiruptor hydrothermalis 108]|uniref:Uncharacterized protein n=1 Tax=Caldicellulosiruptor hydrothermalis (strain DSM 18901 / VKM B-2411 / 108) TaxID=632292 RepID=E4QD06_CALH1|nr:hypothetical protein Calhy_1787 [Caldicellulosiruptor hydrothermalis 108]
MPRRILINIAICILPLVNKIVYMQIGLYTRKYKRENIATCSCSSPLFVYLFLRT